MQEQNTAAASPEKTHQVQTVMVVDDDDNWIFVSKLILKKAGLGNNLITAKNGQEALTKLREFAASNDNQLPDLIFLDIRMPVMDGFEFLEEATKTEGFNLSHSKVYMCSSSLNPIDKERARQYPIAGFVTKPLTKEILQGILG